MAKEINYTKVLSEDSSFQLVRTNPKLTGNIKLTVNSSGDIWLDAIKANRELSKDDYAKVPVDINKSLASSVYKFFKNGTTPAEIIFELKESVDKTKTSKDFKDQYDFGDYFSGIKYFPSNKYDEQLSYFAPIFLKNEVPNYFIILKIKNPLNQPIDVSKQNFENGMTRDQYLIELFNSATLIKTFDLTPESKAGKFIRNYINDPGFPVSPLTVSFDEDKYTTWNGIIVDAGVLGSKGELLYNQYNGSTPLKAFEENITKGFERNGVIIPNILNLEFIFDDDTSDNYEFNRYLGLYVNEIELSKLDIDLHRAYAERLDWQNTPRLRRPYYEYEETNLVQENLTGVEMPYNNLDINMAEFESIFSDSDSLYFNYIIDKTGNLHIPKLSNPYNIDYSNEVTVNLSSGGTLITATSLGHTYSTDDLVNIKSTTSEYAGTYLITVIDQFTFTYITNSAPILPTAFGVAAQDVGSGKMTLSDTRIDIAKFFGPTSDIFLQDTGTINAGRGFSHAVIKLKSTLNHLDEIKIYHTNGSRSDANGKYDLLTSTINYNIVPDAGDYYYFNDYDNVVGYDTFYFNGAGLLSEIATAIAGCLNNVRRRTFNAYALNEYIFIKCTSPGDFDNLHKIGFYSLINDYSTIDLNGISGAALINSRFTFGGGDKFSGNKIVIDKAHLNKINNNINNLLIKTKGGWSKIKKTATYVDLITESTYQKSANVIEALREYNEKILLILENDDTPTATYGEFIIRKKFRPSFGLLSLFPIKDLDFDFYSSEYLNFPIIDLYQHYYIPPNTTILPTGTTYQVIGGTITVDDGFFINEYVDGDTFTLANPSTYSIVSGDPIVTYYGDANLSSSSLIYPINDENKELKDFPGFSILKDPSKVVPQDATIQYSLKTKYLNGLTDTEYDFYKENVSKDFALRSKIIPYITKWRIKEGLDSRDNPYRLNTEIVFGRNNFSPDHTDRSQNPNNFTHEWFYLESKFNYVDDINTTKLNASYFDTPLDLTKLLSDPNYFIEYFTYTPSYGTNNYGEAINVAPTQFRYSKVFKNRANQYETFFKGFKLLFKDVTDSAVLGEDGKPIPKKGTSRFENYKFSCILKTVKEDFLDATQPPIKYQCIEHTDYKFIVLVIEVSLGALDQINDYWKTVPVAPPIYKSITNVNTPLAIEPEVYYVDPTTGVFGSDLPHQTVDGDYRFKFEQIDGINISNISYTLLYSLKHKKFNNLLNTYSNVKLSSKLNITSTGVLYSNDSIGQLIVPQISNYPSIFSDELIILKDNTFVRVADQQIGLTYFIDQVNNSAPSIPLSINPIIGALDQITKFSSNSAFSLAITIPDLVSPKYLLKYNSLGLSTSLLSIINNYYSFSVISGGEQYFEKLFEKLSFAKFKKYVNTLAPIIEYNSYSIDSITGNSVLNLEPNFYLEIAEPATISKNSQIITKVDQDRPSQYSFKQTIAYEYEVATLNNSLELNRYRGEYEPLVKTILHCTSNFKFNKNLIEDLKLSNVKLNTKIDSLLTLQNFNHIKVADTKILDLESDDAYTPQYPLIDEIAIGKSDYFLLSGNWDWGFHHKYSNKLDYLPAAGSVRVEEDQCFLGKIVKIPSFLELENFNLITLTKRQKLSDINPNDTGIELVVKENNTTYEGFINLNNVITRYLLEDGISQKFNEYLTTGYEYIGNFNTIEAYVTEYIKLNILKLYSIEANEFYVKRNADLVSSEEVTNENAIEFSFLNDSQRYAQQYELLRGVQINKQDRLIINFSIQKKLTAGFNISPKIKIKFI
jgi:hypothetical protein